MKKLISIITSAYNEEGCIDELSRQLQAVFYENKMYDFEAIIIENVMLALHEAFPNLKCKPHSHTSSQISYMLKGKLRMRIGDEESVLSPGEIGYVPPNIEHSIESLDEYVLVLDIFSPPRPDISQRLDDLKEKGSSNPLF